ncbi:YciI family protein [Dinghuibacter silviterrae]|uniref:YCII-related domain-containing protein n=1 Tax=Dinghuibacter silviterrae TaxID=1539049 RepID=A0A4R8DV87_9BACT|nr:YciI family protein [Dinghuibacter silviterrae]TDX02332.1 hypothetical protein EDB95_3390 [Dinghuibacter silviterrae]
MKEYALIFHLNDPAMAKPSPQQIQERMNWLAGIVAAGKLANKGNTLSVTEARTVKAGDVVTDGPFTEIKEFIGGYIVVKTETLDEAVQLAKASPLLKVGGSVEVREVMQVYVHQQL